ncbi:MAG: hypothetical protein VB013_10585 [Anaerolineaceae bacterium]|nr:hypothetical protein [Anaerolineaceae bacterium]
MVKKTIWSVILVLVTTCSIFFAKTGLVSSNAGETPVATVEEVGKAITPTATGTIPAVCIPYITTYTPTVAPTATKTATPVVTATPKPTATFTPTATVSSYTFKQQAGVVKFVKNFVHPSAGCNWQGYAGQVFNAAGKPLNDYIIKVTGTYNGKSVSLLGVTGAVSGDPYGPGGYEIVFGSKVIQSIGTLSIQLFDASGTAVSDKYLINTSAFCSKNLAIFNFVAK